MSNVCSDSETEGNTSRNFDETLPCEKVTKCLPQVVLDLQDEYVRIFQHEEEDEEKQVFNSDDSIYRDKKESIRSSARNQGYRLGDETSQTKRETKRLSNASKTIVDPEQVFLSSANEKISGGPKSDAKGGRNVLSKSLPSSQIKKERKRRTSDTNQEINKHQDIYTTTLTPEASLRRQRNREKRNEKDEYSTRSSTSDVTEIASTVLEMPHDQLENSSLRGQTVHTVLNPDDVPNTRTTNKYTSTEGAKMSNNTNRAVTFHESHTHPSIMPSNNISKGDRKSDSVICDNHLASEAYVPECFKCARRGQNNTPAASYCLNCVCHLCQECLKRHNNDKIKMSHNILSGNDMPGSFTIKQKSEKCETQPNKNITFFCEQHTCLCCTECKKGDHMNCANQPIEELLIDTPDISKLKQNVSKASKQKFKSLRELRKKLEKDEETEAKERDELIEDIKKKSSRMIEHIKKLEEGFIKHVNNYFSEKRCCRDKEIKECKQSIKQMYENIQYLDEPKGMKESAIKKVERIKQIEIQTLRIQTCDNENAVRTKTHTFVVNEKLYKTVTEATVLGELSNIVPNKENTLMDQSLLCDADQTIDQRNLNDTENSSDDIPSVSKFQKISVNSVWTEGDFESQTCCTAIEVLDDGNVLISDRDNMKLKWFRSNFLLIKSFKLSSEPWGITQISADKYIVTLPTQRSFQEIDFCKGDITLGRKVLLGIECMCVVRLDEKLMFAGINHDRPSFLLTKLDGSEKQFILTEEKFNLFRRPNHLLKSLTNPNLVFVSDVDKGVFGINVMQREVVFHYTSESLMCSMGMTITEKERLYICSQHTNSIHCISQDGTFLYSVSLQDVMALVTPQCICYIPKQEEFLLAPDNSYGLIRFKLI
jgi:hypothetical protein